ncbi:hypothetical protein CYMTET_55142 [Cymbomonas tetramitiformis]|uniref:Uncharacterized protein n=1 Tax=Cymbomonas tetramitiformis TaxID=36881 RepID=A0AAE0EN93_9CHLO|nr:hypothetical protein CYMTET_55142 [Cymbomonas tetramitiformis]
MKIDVYNSYTGEYDDLLCVVHSSHLHQEYGVHWNGDAGTIYENALVEHYGDRVYIDENGLCIGKLNHDELIETLYNNGFDDPIDIANYTFENTQMYYFANILRKILVHPTYRALNPTLSLLEDGFSTNDPSGPNKLNEFLERVIKSSGICAMLINTLYIKQPQETQDLDLDDEFVDEDLDVDIEDKELEEILNDKEDDMVFLSGQMNDSPTKYNCFLKNERIYLHAKVSDSEEFVQQCPPKANQLYMFYTTYKKPKYIPNDDFTGNTHVNVYDDFAQLSKDSI